MLTGEEMVLVRRGKHKGEIAEASTETENSSANVREGQGIPKRGAMGKDPVTPHFSRNTRAVFSSSCQPRPHPTTKRQDSTEQPPQAANGRAARLVETGHEESN